MTRFVGVAKGSRHKKPASTGGDRRTALAMFQVTGEHPELLEEATVGAAVAQVAPAARTQVRLVFSADGAVLGAPVAVQLFDDRAPESCQSFRARALSAPPQHGALEGAVVCRVQEHVRVDVGGAATSGGGAQPVLEDEGLRHDAPGLVSAELQSGQFTIILSACPALDGKQQVVGRVVSGLETVEQLGREPTDEGGRPKRNVFVCSATTDVGVDAKGSEALMMAAETKAKEAMRQATLKAETTAETRARLEREAAASRHAVAASVNEALQQRKSVAAGARPARGGMMTALLSFSGDDSASEEA